MRLLNTETRKLEFFPDSETPLYAILSHRWGEDEVLFSDIDQGVSYTEKKGYAKLNGACVQAESQGFRYVWIDTCCIDKSSSAELSEAINSMFRWYQDSTVCYAYLVDFESPCLTYRQSRFRRSSWFSRGWTLQELIAPTVVIFYNNVWVEIGTKSSLCQLISEITLIPLAILNGANVNTASVAQRMAWASRRKTTRIEDEAYCLMGIFGINMPMLYGEGEAAFLRLQEEIIKTSDDHSIFAWSAKYVSPPLAPNRDILAPGPSVFFDSSHIIPLSGDKKEKRVSSRAIALDSKGTHVELEICVAMGGGGKRLALLPCAVENAPEARVGIWLCREPGEKDGDNYFTKVPNSPLDTHPYGTIVDPEDSDYYDSDYGDGRVKGTVRTSKTLVCIRRDQHSRISLAPIVKATRQANARVVELLLRKGASPNEVDEAAYADAVKAFRESHGKQSWFDHAFMHRELSPSHHLTLTSNGIRIPGREVILLGAVVRREKSTVKALLEAGARLDVTDRVGRGPITLAVEAECVEMLEWLLERGCDPNSCDLQKWTPLMVAADVGFLPAVELLLVQGANPNATRGEDRLRTTALDLAQRAGHADIVQILKGKTKSSAQAAGFSPRRYRFSRKLVD
jgi:hypothetical protein